MRCAFFPLPVSWRRMAWQARVSAPEGGGLALEQVEAPAVWEEWSVRAAASAVWEGRSVQAVQSGIGLVPLVWAALPGVGKGLSARVWGETLPQAALPGAGVVGLVRTVGPEVRFPLPNFVFPIGEGPGVGLGRRQTGSPPVRRISSARLAGRD